MPAIATPESFRPNVPARTFTTTKWPLVLAASASGTAEGERALGDLCESYWNVLYQYARHLGHGHEAAEDLTQGFVTRLIEKNGFAKVDPARGRLRSFLMTSFRNYISSDRERSTAAKRGGDVPVASLDSCDSQGEPKVNPADNATPESAFERKWMETLLQTVLGRLSQEMEGKGLGSLFQDVKDLLHGERGAERYAAIATRHGMTEGAFKVVIFRVRRRYRDLLHEEIRATVDTPDAVADELRQLLRIASGA